MTLQEQFGQIDIYLFDQILRSNISPGMRVVDAGCGGGRNIQYLLRAGYEVFGVDTDPAAVEAVRKMASELAPALPAGNFQVTGVEAMPFTDEFADVVVCHSVLHFARDETQLEWMVRGLWRVLRPGGLLFCRLASTIGAVEGMALEPLGGRRFRMSHGPVWLLVDEPLLMEFTHALGGDLVDPLKTTVVQGQRCMTTWVVKKSETPGAKGSTFVSSGMPGRKAQLNFTGAAGSPIVRVAKGGFGVAIGFRADQLSTENSQLASQFPDGLSIRSITTVSIIPFAGLSRRPSSCSSTVKSPGAAASSIGCVCCADHSI